MRDLEDRQAGLLRYSRRVRLRAEHLHQGGYREGPVHAFRILQPPSYRWGPQVAGGGAGIVAVAVEKRQNRLFLRAAELRGQKADALEAGPGGWVIAPDWGIGRVSWDKGPHEANKKIAGYPPGRHLD